MHLSLLPQNSLKPRTLWLHPISHTEEPADILVLNHHWAWGRAAPWQGLTSREREEELALFPCMHSQWCILEWLLEVLALT